MSSTQLVRTSTRGHTTSDNATREFSCPSTHIHALAGLEDTTNFVEEGRPFLSRTDLAGALKLLMTKTRRRVEEELSSSWRIRSRTCRGYSYSVDLERQGVDYAGCRGGSGQKTCDASSRTHTSCNMYDKVVVPSQDWSDFADFQVHRSVVRGVVSRESIRGQTMREVVVC